MMTRRTFLCWLTLGILSMPLAGEAEQAERVYRVAVILAGSPVSGISKNPFLNAFTERLRELGYVEGQNILFARLSAEGRVERHAHYASISSSSRRLLRKISEMLLLLHDGSASTRCTHVTALQRSLRG